MELLEAILWELDGKHQGENSQVHLLQLIISLCLIHRKFEKGQRSYYDDPI